MRCAERRLLSCRLLSRLRLRRSGRIFFVAVNLRPVLAPFSEGEYERLGAAVDASRKKLGFLLLGYVFMPDHFHALIWPSYPLTISRVIQDIKWTSSRAVNRARKTSGHLWQHQFWDRFIRNGRELRQRLDYLHFNPVRKGLVKCPESWRWSSCNNFALNQEVVKKCPMRVDYIHLPQSYRG